MENILTDDEEKEAGDTIDWRCEYRGSFKENTNTKDSYTENQKDTVKGLRTHHEQGCLEKFDTNRTRQESHIKTASNFSNWLG